MTRRFTQNTQIVLAVLTLCVPCVARCLADDTERAAKQWKIAERRSDIYADCAHNVSRLLQGWLDLKQDPKTRLFSKGGRWDDHNEAADHYSSLVLMAFYVNPRLNQKGGPLHETLVNSQRLCTTPSSLPATYDLKKFAQGKEATFGALSEWLRDGLLRVVEVMGRENDWYREMERLVGAMIAEADRRGGMLHAFRGHEPQGNILQTLARLYAMSGEEKYLNEAEELADALLLDPRHAVRDVRFQDHGCELVPGLGELFVLESQLGRAKTAEYHAPMRRLLDGILQSAAHPETGLLCRPAKAADGNVGWSQSTDTWGYVLFTLENYDRATGENRYREAILKPMRWLAKNRPQYPILKNSLWPRSVSSDDWSDSHESMLVLWNRYRDVEGAFDWLDWSTHQHCHRRTPDAKYGPYNGGHFDGSTGRCLCLHMMLCSQGVRAIRFTEGVGVGAVQDNGELLLSVSAAIPWSGKLRFDSPRCEFPTATINWARLNEMPQWFVVRPDKKYHVCVDGSDAVVVDGGWLIEGFPLEVDEDQTCRICVRAVESGG